MSIFHLKFPHMKHEENSIRGIHTAKRRGFTEIDLDMCISEDNRVIGCHWSEPLDRDGFKDPLHKLGRHAVVSKLPLSVIMRLRARTWFRVYRIQPIEVLLSECARLHIGAVLEPKGDPRFCAAWPWEFIAKEADRLGCNVRVYALPQNAAALPYARAAGLKAAVIR